MTTLRHDRVIPLKDLSYYAGSEWLDMTLYLPWDKDTRRRVWLMIPQSSPTLSLDDTTLEPQNVPERQPRWIDYGIVRLPLLTEPNWALGEFYQLRLRGLTVAECAASYLLISANLDLSLAGHSLEQAERKLWGLARSEAGTTTLQPARVTVGAGATFTARYTAGPKGLPSGALVRFVVAGAFSRPQTKDPDAPGFVSITRADSKVSIAAIITSVESHEKIDIICRLASKLAPAEGFVLRYYTDRTYIFPAEFHEVERWYWYSRLPPLAAAVALSDQSPFVSLDEHNSHTFQVEPSFGERLHLFLPGRRFASEKLSLKGTFTDRYRNAPPADGISFAKTEAIPATRDRQTLSADYGRAPFR
jgi:hypothetical protein